MGVNTMRFFGNVFWRSSVIRLRMLDHRVSPQDAFDEFSNHANSSRIGQ